MALGSRALLDPASILASPQQARQGWSGSLLALFFSSNFPSGSWETTQLLVLGTLLRLAVLNIPAPRRVLLASTRALQAECGPQPGFRKLVFPATPPP